MVIGIGGISGAGKTTLSEKLAAAIKPRGIVIHLDTYIRFGSNCRRINNLHDWEHPDAVDFRAFHHEIISRQRDIPIVIIEGFLVAWQPEIRGLMDVYIHIQLSEETFRSRRKSKYNEPEWYIDHVWRSYRQFGENYHHLRHIIIDGSADIDPDRILNLLHTGR